jgi:DNA-binding transcriptional MerR regulator
MSHPAPDDRQQGLTLGQLVEGSGVSKRTIRYYVQNKLIASPGRGAHALYPLSDVDRVHLIRRWQDLGRTLAEIGGVLACMSDAEVAVALKESAKPPGLRRQCREATTWDHIELADGVELRIRRPGSTESNRLADQMLAACEDVLRRAVY